MRRILALLFPLLLAFLVVSKGAEWISEKWWFESLGQGQTWRHLFAWRAGAFLVGAPLWAAIMGFNVALAWRRGMAARAPLSLLGGALEGIELELSPALRLGQIIARSSVWSAAWLAGLAAANRFDLWVLAATPGARDAGDVGWFLFRLPALDWSLNWLGVALGLTFAGCLLLYFWLEAIETGPGVLRASAAARSHLAILGALLIAWKGAACALAAASAPVVFGWSPGGILGVPEHIAGAPTSQFFAWSALPVAFVVAVLGARERGRGALILCAGWLVSAALLPSLAPSFARSLGVGDDVSERLAIAAHLDATRRAWDIGEVRNVPLEGKTEFTPTTLGDNSRGAPVALWPLDAARQALEETLAGDAPSTLRAARLHVVRGANDQVMGRAIVTQRDARGEAPARQLEARLDVAGPLRASAPQTLDALVLTQEPVAGETSNNRLGPAPVEMNEGATTWPAPPPYRVGVRPQFAVEHAAPGANLVLAARFLEAPLLAPGPPLSWHLEPVARAQTLAPFVNWEGAFAHPVVLESGVGPHVYWMVEGCFTARTFPGAATLPAGEIWGGINYARPDVLAVFDGSSGAATFYLLDSNEPLARVWSRAFPSLFRPLGELRPELRAQIQPAPGWLNALSRIYTRYHPQPGDEIRAWSDRSSEWRAIFSENDAGTPAWHEALLPTDAGARQWWHLCAFAPARGTLSSTLGGESPPALSAIIGVTGAPGTAWNWQQWRPTTPLALPEIATEPLPNIARENRLPLAQPFRIGAFPSFDGAGNADGFTLFRAQVKTPLDAKGNPKGVPNLEVESATTGAARALAAPDAPGGATLERARVLWEGVLNARRQNNWKRAAQLEAQLGAALRIAPAIAPTRQPTPTPTASKSKPSASPMPQTTATPNPHPPKF